MHIHSPITFCYSSLLAHFSSHELKSKLSLLVSFGRLVCCLDASNASGINPQIGHPRREDNFQNHDKCRNLAISRIRFLVAVSPLMRSGSCLLISFKFQKLYGHMASGSPPGRAFGNSWCGACLQCELQFQVAIVSISGNSSPPGQTLDRPQYESLYEKDAIWRSSMLWLFSNCLLQLELWHFKTMVFFPLLTVSLAP